MSYLFTLGSFFIGVSELRMILKLKFHTLTSSIHAKHNLMIDDELEKELAELFKVELTELYLERSYYFYNPQTMLDLIITGLCFGYPIESTVDCILG